MLLMLALGATAYTLTPPGALARPSPSASSSAQVATELGGMIHFPEYLTSPGWPEAESALDRLKATLGPRAYVRYDGLWHTWNWDRERPSGYERNARIVGLLARRGLRSLMVLTPHPWPGSTWDGAPTTRDWGAPKPEWFPAIASRYRDAVRAYREALRANGMAEAANAIQWGNEPASGNPGGNGKLPPGTWSGHALWRELHRDVSMYGRLQVVAPAYSVLDTPHARVEMATSRVPGGLDWTAPVDRRAMHFRHYRPNLASPTAYAQDYVTELARRAALVQALPFPQGSPSKQASRRDGLWVTEAYVASGDVPEPRGEAWRRILSRVREGIPGVRVFFAYRFHPAGGPGGLDWRIPLDAQRPLGTL